MQTLRKKTSPCKYKNETSRFLGEGVSFKAKLIGILEVNEARGDRMCQEALSDLKMAIRAAGEHKQRITINIAIDGLRLRDEKTGDSLYHHPVHKISFIAQDMSDSRAFGYIFGSPDTGHRFFGIKTDKAASQVVIAMRDLFQVVFALKKKEIELAKQHLEHKSRYGSSSLFPDSSTKNQNGESQTAKAAATSSETKPSANAEASSTTAVADLVNLELELSSLQQGLTQMKSITPSDPFGPKDDPFGDSFTSYPQKPFLPPPPSAKDRQSTRTHSTDTTIFSPKTPKTGGSTDAIASESLFNTSREDPSSDDWFTPTATESAMFEESTATLAPEKEPNGGSSSSSRQQQQQDILSQFDVFTELDPLGTGRSKPYVDKKLFFQELKNPPKKVLKDLVSETFPPPAGSAGETFAANFESSNFQSDPFGDDPFVKSDPFAEADFAAKDPFNTDEFAVAAAAEYARADNFKFPPPHNSSSLNTASAGAAAAGGAFIFPPPAASILEKTSRESSPRNTAAAFPATFDDATKVKLAHLHENPSLDLSSESECAPEPPPRPPPNIQPIKPPPLPPKKQFGEAAAKPPPRPPHDDAHYDYIYETGPARTVRTDPDPSPPLPVPARKSRFESDFVPERPKKQQLQALHSLEDDYLQPVAPPLLPPQKKTTHAVEFRSPGNLLPPPHKREAAGGKKSPTPNTAFAEKFNLDTLDITLSQLTLSGLNELATKLNIPSSQLSNMTLVQLTSYISNHLTQQKQENETLTKTRTSTSTVRVRNEYPTFKADFDANFSDINVSDTNSTQTNYDRYAVFRELIDEEIKQTKIETTTDVDEDDDEEEDDEEELEEDNRLDVEPSRESETRAEENANGNATETRTVSVAFSETTAAKDERDRYAALREIIVEEEDFEEAVEEQPEDLKENEMEQQQNDLNQQSMKIELEIDKTMQKDSNIIEYEAESQKEINKSPVLSKSPTIQTKQPSSLVKSPVPIAITEIIQTNNHLTSGSLSDVVSGSSPEVDNTGSASETVTKKNVEKTSESWAIFDTPNMTAQEATKEKQQVQSEEGVSPWSSDSKEFGNGSPTDWRQRMDSESGGDNNCVRRRKNDGGDREWWDSAAETGGYKPYQQNRRSTDSYEDDGYDQCYEKPRRRRQQAWSGQAAGGHSSSSRDVSPWEEEPRNRREPWMRRRPPSYDRHRRHDSWDEEDDFEYEEEHMGRFHWHDSRDFDRGANPRELERHPADRWAEPEWTEDRRQRRRPRGPDDHWCCPDWEHDKDVEGPPGHYSSGRWSNPDSKWRDGRKQQGYYGSQRDPHERESPWEDDQEEPPQSPRYLTAKRNWKRPSSASEMDRKTGEIKSRPFYERNSTTGGSDGERDRRYKSGRRSKSRDSTREFPGEMREHQRHKPDPGLTLRYPHRSKPQQQGYKSGFENDFNLQDAPKGKGDAKPSSQKLGMGGRKKSKESVPGKMDPEGSLPRRGPIPSRVQQSMFESDFVPSETDSPRNNSRFSFENDFETSEAESPTIVAGGRSAQARTKFEEAKRKQPNAQVQQQRASILKTAVNSSLDKEGNKSVQYKQRTSLFEDDFSPSAEKAEDDYGISSIREEPDVGGGGGGEGNDTFAVAVVAANTFDRTTNLSRKQKQLKNRNSLRSGEVNIKKSESVNIFARESDPFDDDDFFSGHDSVGHISQPMEISSKAAPRNPEFKWTEDFDSFDNGRRK